MAFCENCGQQISDGAKFCRHCGAGAQATEEKKTTERKTVFTGEIQKCPNCGEVLDSFVSACPSCGMEIRGAKANDAVAELAEQLKKVDEEKTQGFFAGLGKIINAEEEAKEKRKKKAEIIRNFPVPNTKEDITEFMILATTNIESEAENQDAWRTKLDQVYSKAKILFENTSDFEKIQKMYEGVSKKTKQNKIKSFIPFILGGILVLTIIIIIAVNASKGSNDGGDLPVPDGYIKTEMSSDDMIGENYEDMIIYFESLGFENIEIRELADLITGWITKDGDVESVSINGDTDFSKNDYFPEDAKIIITYHTFEE